MAQNKFDIYVYAHWKGMTDPKLIGILSAHFAKTTPLRKLLQQYLYNN